MKLLTQIILLVTLFSTFGCSSPEKAEQISRVDSLQTTVDSLKTLLTKMDTTTAHQNKRRIQSDLVYVQQAFKDTMEKETGIKLGNYMRHGQLYSKLENNYKKATEEAEALTVQLKNLKQDVENNLLEKEKFKEYFTIEKRDVNKLKTMTEMLDQAYAGAIQKQAVLDSIVEEILTKIKQNPTDSVEQE